MCPPASHLATSQSALRQWERLVELLCVAGDVQVERVDLPSESLEQAFAGNTALICGNLAIMSSVRRRSERSLCRSWLAARGYATTALEQAPFGGACDALFDRVRPYLYVGYGGRTERSAAIALSELTDARVIPLRLIDERFPHLDRALCPLGSGHVMFYPAAFSAQSQRLIRRSLGVDDLIELSDEDAFVFACSPIEVGDALVVGEISQQLRSRLQFAGYRVFSTDLSEFTRLGGTPRSLALRLDDGPACGAAAA
jgi:N-dimethylarginine dimethylaminohydrolase